MEENKKNIQWFHFNKKYLSICQHAIIVIFVAIILYILVSKWGHTSAMFSGFIRVLSPFLLGVLIAYFLHPLVMLIQRKILKYITKGKYPVVTKIVAIILAYVIVLGVIAVGMVFVVPQIINSIRDLTERIPVVYRSIFNFLIRFEKRHPELWELFPDMDIKTLNQQLAGIFPNIVGYGSKLLGNLLPAVYSFSVSIVKGLINLLLAIFISIYMIFSKDTFKYDAKRMVYAIFSKEKGDVICETCAECNDIFSSFLISKAIDSLIIGILCFILMTILQLPYAVLLSVIVGITNMIPYFGPFIGAIPGVLIYLCTDWKVALVFAIMILCLQQFDGLILGPKLLGQSTGLSPIWVIFGITVGGAYFGVVGMFVGVPVVAVIAYLCNRFVSARLSKRNINIIRRPREGSADVEIVAEEYVTPVVESAEAVEQENAEKRIGEETVSSEETTPK